MSTIPAAPTVDADEQAVAETVARAISRLRRQDHRITVARRAIIETLARQPGHPNAAELSAEIENRYPGIHRATVYRTLEVLTDLGVVTHIHLSHGATAYHLTGTAAGHLHAQCRFCGRVYDLPADLLDQIRARLAGERRFRLDPRHVALSGACESCHGRRLRQRRIDRRRRTAAAKSVFSAVRRFDRLAPWIEVFRPTT